MQQNRSSWAKLDQPTLQVHTHTHTHTHTQLSHQSVVVAVHEYVDFLVKTGHTKLYTDPRIDLQALTLAQKFQSACNIFLREAARSYLNMLDELKISPPFNILG